MYLKIDRISILFISETGQDSEESYHSVSPEIRGESQDIRSMSSTSQQRKDNVVSIFYGLRPSFLYF